MEQIGRLAHAVELGARHVVHVLWHGRTRAHEDSIEAMCEEIVDGDAVLAHHGVGDEVDTELGNLFDFSSYHRLGQTIFGNAEHQHAAGLLKALVDRHGETFAGQVTGYGESGWSRSDDGDVAARLLWQLLALQAHLSVEVSDEGLQTSNLHGVAFLVEHAVALALFLVWADTSTDSRQVRRLVDDGHGVSEVALGELMDKRGNVIADGTALAAKWHLAVETALGLLDSFLHRQGLRRAIVDLLFLHVTMMLVLVGCGN